MSAKSRVRALAIGATLSLVAVAPAFAGVVEFQNVSGAWSSPTGASVSYSGNGTGNAQVRWGTSTGYGRSGYNFKAVSLAPISLTAPEDFGPFNIGKFEHVNYPITGGAIDGVDLLFSADVLVDGVLQGTRTFTYHFTHEETPNGPWMCAYGGLNGHGVNKNGCADRVTTEFNSLSDTFQVGADLYTLSISGFLVDGLPRTEFLTKEKKLNTAYIQGKISLVASAVPEPVSWATMILGFGVVGGLMRARRRLLPAD